MERWNKDAGLELDFCFLRLAMAISTTLGLLPGDAGAGVELSAA
jgi:hypothetical protein